MNIKVFAYQGTLSWSSPWSSQIPTDKMELEIQDWLAKNPRIKVHELKHDLVQHPFRPSKPLSSER